MLKSKWLCCLNWRKRLRCHWTCFVVKSRSYAVTHTHWDTQKTGISSAYWNVNGCCMIRTDNVETHWLHSEQIHTSMFHRHRHTCTHAQTHAHREGSEACLFNVLTAVLIRESLPHRQTGSFTHWAMHTHCAGLQPVFVHSHTACSCRFSDYMWKNTEHRAAAYLCCHI